MKRLCAAAVTSALILCSAAAADEWPSRPVRMVNTFAAGGTADTLTRLVADHLSTTFKQKIVFAQHTRVVPSIDLPPHRRCLCPGMPIVNAATIKNNKARPLFSNPCSA